MDRVNEYRARRSEPPSPAYAYFEPSPYQPHKPLMPEDRAVYPESAGTNMRVASPVKAPGKPWEVKPYGYWTRWTPEQRKIYDEGQVKLDQERHTEKPIIPRSSDDLRTPPRPASQELIDLITRQQDEAEQRRNNGVSAP